MSKRNIKITYALKTYIKQIWNDSMMVMCIIAPILMGIVFKLVVPVLESVLCNEFNKAAILAPYYEIFDLLLSMMTPTMLCFAGVLVILEEFDNGIAKYYFVTPIGKSGYLLSRIGIPAIAGFIYNMLLLWSFSLVSRSIVRMLALSLSGSLIALITALLVVSYAKNKMEGMALVKLSGLIMMGVPIAYFISGPISYAFSLLPSFWIAKLCITSNNLFLIPTMLSSALLIALLYQKFKKKLI